MHPILFHIGGHAIASFGFFVATAIAAAYLALQWAIGKRSLDSKVMALTLAAVVVGGYFGARLMAGIVYWASLDQSSTAFFQGLDAMSDTGLWVFGEITIALSAWLLGARPLAVLDAWAFAAAAASPIGRIGCLMAGCCYGVGTTMPWGIHYPPDHPGTIAAHGMALHPTPLYISLGVAALWLVLRYQMRHQAPEGQILLTAWLGYALVRGTVELFRADVARGAWFGGMLSSYQLICLSAALLHLVLLRKRVWGGSSEPVPVPDAES